MRRVLGRSGIHPALRDLSLVAVAFILSLAAGSLTNLIRTDPLPFRYLGREARLLASAPELAREREPAAATLAQAEAAWRNHAAAFLDAREPDFFEEGHIPGATNFPASRIRAPHRLPEDKEAPLIVYCSGADCSDSRIVAKSLAAAGYRRVAVFSGGWDAWTAAGLPK
ncbi:MAG: rhodanese-like domain-containing protein [Verrucomicrobiae bacterium]